MQLTKEQLQDSFSEYLDENYHVDQLSEGNVVWVFENEFMPALFEAYVDEYYHLDQLSEENVQWIYEEEFLHLIGQEELSEEAGARRISDNEWKHHRGGKIVRVKDMFEAGGKKHTSLKNAIEHLNKQGPVEESASINMYSRFIDLQEKKKGKKIDWDKDGDNDGMDALINKFVQYGMSQEDAIKKARQTMGNKGKK